MKCSAFANLYKCWGIMRDSREIVFHHTPWKAVLAFNWFFYCSPRAVIHTIVSLLMISLQIPFSCHHAPPGVLSNLTHIRPYHLTVSWCCCDKLRQTWWLKRTKIYSLNVLHVRNMKSVSLGWTNVSAQPWSLWRL